MAKIEIKKEEEEKPSKKEFAALIEAYKAKNPVKYEKKKAALEAQLAKL